MNLLPNVVRPFPRGSHTRDTPPLKSVAPDPSGELGRCQVAERAVRREACEADGPMGIVVDAPGRDLGACFRWALTDGTKKLNPPREAGNTSSSCADPYKQPFIALAPVMFVFAGEQRLARLCGVLTRA